MNAGAATAAAASNTSAEGTGATGESLVPGHNLSAAENAAGERVIPGAFVIESAMLKSESGEQDIRPLITTVTIVAELDSPIVVCKVRIHDDVQLFNSLKLNGREILNLKLQTWNGDEEVITDMTFIAKSYPEFKRGLDTQSYQDFSIVFVSPVAFYSRAKQISQSVKGVCSTIIEELFSKHLGGVAEFTVEGIIKCTTKMQAVITYRTPLQAIEWIRSLTYDEDGGEFKLFGNIQNNKVVLRSLKDIISQPPLRSYTYTRLQIAEPGTVEHVREVEKKLLDIDITPNMDMMDLVQHGGFGNTVAVIDYQSRMVDDRTTKPGDKNLQFAKEVPGGSSEPFAPEELVKSAIKFIAKPIQLFVDGGGGGYMPGMGGMGAGGPMNMMPVSGGINGLVNKYETGGVGPGAITNSAGDHGGASYGTYQFSANTRSLQTFLSRSGYASQFGGAAPGSPAFDATWRRLAANPQFAQAQTAEIQRTSYQPIASYASSRGLNTRSNAMQNVLLSTSVQHGAGGSRTIMREAMQSLGVRSFAGVSDADAIRAIYAARGRPSANGGLAHFSSSSPAIQRSVANRYTNEQRDALALLGAGGEGTAGMAGAAGAAPPAGALPPPPIDPNVGAVPPYPSGTEMQSSNDIRINNAGAAAWAAANLSSTPAACTVYGDINLNPGNMIALEVYKVGNTNDMLGGSGDDVIDLELSGDYLITVVAHSFVEGVYSTQLSLARKFDAEQPAMAMNTNRHTVPPANGGPGMPPMPGGGAYDAQSMPMPTAMA